MREAKVGQTGTFWPRGGFDELTFPVYCRVLSIDGEKLHVLLEDGEETDITKESFTPMYVLNFPEKKP